MNKRVYRWIFAAAKSAAGAIAAVTALALALSFINLGFTAVSKTVLDTAAGDISGSLIKQCAALAVLLLLEISAQTAITLISTHAGAKVEISMKSRLFSALMKKSYTAVSSYHSGDILNRLTSDVSVISSAVLTVIPNVVMLCAGLILSAAYLFRLDGGLTVFIVIAGAIGGAGARIYSRRFKELHKKCQQTEGRTRSFMQEMLQNILVIKSFGAGDEAVKKSSALQRENYRWQIKRAKASAVARVFIFMLYNAGYYLVLAYGAWRLAAGAFTFGTVTALLQLVNKIQTPFKDLSSVIPQVYQAAASAERLLELEDIPDGGAAKRLPEDVFRGFSDISFTDVSFSYDGSKTIKIPDFTAERGRITVLAGSSGGGKSTAVKLMMGILNPKSGEVCVRRGAERYSTDEYGSGFFSYVPQGNLIFSGSIRENITFAAPDADDAAVKRAAETAQIADFISSLPDGLDTALGEHGLGLSEGQAQRISVARAVLFDAPVLILDESTSALDPETEEKMLSAIRDLGKTVIFISHREAAVEFADKIVTVGG